MIPAKAFILAAGYGKRLRPYTDTRPKPLAEVDGRSLIDRTLDQLNTAGIKDVMINTHYLADILTAHLQNRKTPKLHFSHEDVLLDTGGGIQNALGHFGNEPFFVLSGDGLWEDDPKAPALKSLSEHWNPEAMDILILLQPVSSMKLTQGAGDYDLDASGRVYRSPDKTGQYMFTSMRINSPAIFKNAPKAAAFSYLDLLDQAEKQGRLFGLVHAGDWHHISTPQDLESVNEAWEARNKASG